MKLIFVYNADSGFANTLMDIGHKIISPDTYKCNLCDLTFGVFSEQKEWKQYHTNKKAPHRWEAFLNQLRD